MFYRPQLESVEDRLPPGDAFGWLLIPPSCAMIVEPSIPETTIQRGARTECPAGTSSALPAGSRLNEPESALHSNRSSGERMTAMAAPPGLRRVSPGHPGAASLGLPALRFEANYGQTDPDVRFLAHGRGYDLFLTSAEAVMVLDRRLGPGAAPTAGTVLRMQLVGANPAAAGFGLRQLPGKVNYYLGDDPADWHANIPTYSQVEYEGIYSGISLRYYSSNG